MRKFFRSLVLSAALLPTLHVAQAVKAADTATATGAPSISVTTYHYNNLRTGWNQNETLLNAAAFPTAFGVLATVAAELPLGATARVSGRLLAIDGTTLTLLTRMSRTVQVDISAAVETEQVAKLIVGQPYTALGDSAGSAGNLRAVSVMRAKRGSGAWPEDHE